MLLLQMLLQIDLVDYARSLASSSSNIVEYTGEVRECSQPKSEFSTILNVFYDPGFLIVQYIEYLLPITTMHGFKYQC